MKFFIVLGALCFIQLACAQDVSLTSEEDSSDSLSSNSVEIQNAPRFFSRISCVIDEVYGLSPKIVEFTQAINRCVVDLDGMPVDIVSNLQTLQTTAGTLRPLIYSVMYGNFFEQGSAAMQLMTHVTTVRPIIQQTMASLANVASNSPTRVCVETAVRILTQPMQNIANC